MSHDQWVTNKQLWDLIAPAIGIQDRDYVTKLTVVIDFSSIPHIEIEELLKDSSGAFESKITAQKFELVPIGCGNRATVDINAGESVCTAGSSPWVIRPNFRDSATDDTKQTQ